MTNVGFPYKIQTADPLLEDQITLELTTGGSPVSATYNVPQGRGDIKAFEIYVGNNEIDDLVEGYVTVMGNKQNLLDQSPLLRHAALYNNDKKPILCTIPEKAVVSIMGVNANAAASIFITVVFRFYNPYVVQPVQ